VRTATKKPNGAGPIRDRMPDALAALVRGLDVADRASGGALLGDRSTLDRGAVLRALSASLVRILAVAHAEAHGIAPPGGERTIAQVHDDMRAYRSAGCAWTRLAGAGRWLEGPLEAWARPLNIAPIADASARAVVDAMFPKGAAEAGAIEVEEVAGAYEGIVGFELRVARGPTMLLLPDHVGVDLADLLATPPTERAARVASAGARLAASLAQASTTDALALALARRRSPRSPGLLPPGSLYVEPGTTRRARGAYYTPRSLTEPLVSRAIAPLLERSGDDAEAVLSLTIVDPAMGTGAFLTEACRQMAARLTAIDPSTTATEARRRVAERCLHGVDVDPLAVAVARAALWLAVGSTEASPSIGSARLLEGDALLGGGAASGPSREAAEATARAVGSTALHWDEAFLGVMARGGFDAVVGNPPWVAYAGRAAQPLDESRFNLYVGAYASFFGYRTLHGIFVERSASILAPGGRLGLVVPTSVSDLGGYAPTRRAHDALAEVDPELPDFGNAFEGVFQPSMGLLSTRRAAPAAGARDAVWRVERDDVDAVSEALLARLSSLPPLPPACFGERGFQSTSADAKKLRATETPEPPFVVPIREGSHVRAFRALPPRVHLDPTGLSGKLRSAEEFAKVSLLVRQTARFPIAARADGVAFRNSILAAFAIDPLDADALLAWLNSAPIRWLHYMRNRDARQGMPQVKIAHLRAVPTVPETHVERLRSLGAWLGARNGGVTAAEQASIDEAVSDALGLDAAERALVAAWALANEAP